MGSEPSGAKKGRIATNQAERCGAKYLSVYDVSNLPSEDIEGIFVSPRFCEVL